MSHQISSSEASRWDRILARATNIVVLIAGLMTLAVGARYLTAFANTGPTSGGPSAQRAPVVGQKLTLDGVDWAAGERTLVLALSPTCRYCLESNSFYQELTNHLKDQRRVRVVALFGVGEAAGREYVAQHGLSVSQVASQQTAEIGATPTLLVVNKRGEVEKVWVGKLSQEQQHSVRAQLE